MYQPYEEGSDELIDFAEMCILGRQAICIMATTIFLLIMSYSTKNIYIKKDVCRSSDYLSY